jgi:phospholipid/cholesterol/gamma-HCH transport system substrate-binding protein
MENRAHALIAGLFILLLGSALVAAVVWFRGDHVQRTEHTVVSRNGVPGLTVKAPVKLRGVEVGNVESIAFDPANSQQILIRIAVDSAAPLTRGTTARLGYQGVTGLSFIDLGDSGRDTRPLADAPEAERRLTLQPSLFESLSAQGPALLATLSETAQRMNALLDKPNQERLARLLDTAEHSVAEFGQRAHDLKPALAALPQTLQHLDAAAQRAEATLARADATADATTRLVDDLRGRLVLLDTLGSAALRIEDATRALEYGLVGPTPYAERPLVEELGLTARGLDRTVNLLGEQPSSLLFGKLRGRAGPGEAGWEAPGGAAK